MDLHRINRVYLLGIGGIGMSALARYFLGRGCQVSGYDRTQTPLTLELEEQGIPISYTDELRALPSFLLKQTHDGILPTHDGTLPTHNSTLPTHDGTLPIHDGTLPIHDGTLPTHDGTLPTHDEHTLIIYTPSVPKDSKIRTWLEEGKFKIYKRSEVLGIISRSLSVLAVAGTHGKTTTSTLLAHLLKNAGIQITAFLGGISSNYETNFLQGDSKWVVVEADEYDRSFLTLFPHAAAITSMDADHLDIYGSKENMVSAYNQFAAQVIPDGLLLAKKGLSISRAYVSYGLNEENGLPEVRANNIRINEGCYHFDYFRQAESINDLQLSLPGRHNIENALAAITLALHAGLNANEIRAGIASFKGVKRRFEVLSRTASSVYVDDYAHHPAELSALLKTARELFPDKKLNIIFQPHLFSRTRDFYLEMAQALSLADRVILLEIYPAREQPIDGITSNIILDKITLKAKSIQTKHEVLESVKAEPEGVWITAGAGDIDQLTHHLSEIFNSGKEQHNE